MKKTLQFDPDHPSPGYEHLRLWCPCCPEEGSGLIPAEKDAVTRTDDTIYIKFFCPSGCDPVLVIDGEKADTRMFWLTSESK